jgi:hypothetical protein
MLHSVDGCILDFQSSPTFSVYRVVDGEYEVQRFRGNGSINSALFGSLELTAEPIFNPE